MVAIFSNVIIFQFLTIQRNRFKCIQYHFYNPVLLESRRNSRMGRQFFKKMYLIDVKFTLFWKVLRDEVEHFSLKLKFRWLAKSQSLVRNIVVIGWTYYKHLPLWKWEQLGENVNNIDWEPTWSFADRFFVLPSFKLKRKSKKTLLVKCFIVFSRLRDVFRLPSPQKK